MPENWVMDHPGWVKYSDDGSHEYMDDLGDEEVVCFDVETLYKLSKFPVMATAATKDGWYSWLCPTIFETPPDVIPSRPAAWEKDEQIHHPHDLIPLFKGDKERLVVGHNVGYDRARIAEEYSLERTPTRYIDTLALHVATRGITSVQRPAWMIHRKRQTEKAKMKNEVAQYLEENVEDYDATEESVTATVDELDGADESNARKWEDVTSMNSLAEVASLHCGIPVDKSIRNRFGDESITHASQLLPELHELLTYCANDVKVTHQVHQKVLPLFLESCPHPATFSGVLTMGNSFLPVDEGWKGYLKNAEMKYRELDEGVRRALRILAEKVRKEGMREGDVWYDQLDWSAKNARWPDEGENVPDIAREFLSGSVEPGLSKDRYTAVEDASAIATIGRSAQTTDAAIDAQAPMSNDIGTAEMSTPDSAGVGSLLTSSPVWYGPIQEDASAFFRNRQAEIEIIPLLLRMTYKSHPVFYLKDHYWCFKVPNDLVSTYTPIHGDPVTPNDEEMDRFGSRLQGFALFNISRKGQPRLQKLTGVRASKLFKNSTLGGNSEAANDFILEGISGIEEDLVRLADECRQQGSVDDWTAQLDWTDSNIGEQTGVPTWKIADPNNSAKTKAMETKSAKAPSGAYGIWPKWYWDLTRSATNPDVPFGALDLTCKKSVAPILLRLQWDGFPLFHSREFKWLYRVAKNAVPHPGASTRDFTIPGHGVPVTFLEPVESGDGSSTSIAKADEHLARDTEHWYFRLPHAQGEGKNVGNPLSKPFVKAIESGQLASAAAFDGNDAAAKAATDATQMNVLCSYWVAARERIMDQMVIYKTPNLGIILPQVITMGTVTRRAVEATWLTASNAKKNRIGSELKAMVCAPAGYAIVGADVDSEELWISSVMGDSQFGMHGATAIGWMTLEGTKSAGTDLHSKTASILSTTRDAAKVFNYSRIYGAGQKHAEQLLVQGDPTLNKTEATHRAKELYARTKGEKSKRGYQKPPARINSLWHGGTESYLFNTLEAIALSDRPTTPALGCGITKALSKNYLEESSAYLPSRINWVVQSSGVDYLHLLIVSMEYLIKTYGIDARYLISVHDEVRYLAKHTDKYRCALALQIANAWTRALFCYNLGIDDVPQGVAFFSAVDIDHVLRKEVFMNCQTPSHPDAIPPGESLDIAELLKLTKGDLGKPVSDLTGITKVTVDHGPPVRLIRDIESPRHAAYLDLQANRETFPVKAWLDSQEELREANGEVLAARKFGRRRKGQKVVSGR
jgi:DNA polymerase gamma 1